MTGPALSRADRIFLRDHVRDLEIGAFASERTATQRLGFEIVVEVTPDTGGTEDDVDTILSYDTILAAIDTATAAERLNLLETLAERIAALLLAEPRAGAVEVELRKLDRGPFALGVAIRREKPGVDRGPAPASSPAAAAIQGDGRRIAPPPVPRLALMGEEAALPTGDGPLILLPRDAPSMVATHHAEADLRRALLALEQAGWALIARHPDLTMVASRTEIEHARRIGAACVWAPAKLILDTPGAPRSADPARLIAWLAEDLGIAPAKE
ncbi:MAG: dihydroneopterin aldolase [Celeribacter sp.]|jgi:dihydroneopterin aldolase